LDRLNRKIIQLKIEREALKKETDEASKQRFADLEKQLKIQEKEYSGLDEIWKKEKAAIQSAQKIKEELDQAKLEMEAAKRNVDLTKMSELQYGKIPSLEKQLQAALKAEKNETHLVRNKVTEEEVAEVVSKWTHIPVSKMLEGEKEKLLQMEDALHKRVIDQNEAIKAVSSPHTNAPAPILTSMSNENSLPNILVPINPFFLACLMACSNLLMANGYSPRI